MKTEKVCSQCRRLLSLGKFPPDNRSKDGKQSACRDCVNQWMKEHYRRHPAEYMLRRARARATQKGFDFNLHLEDITPLPLHCPVLGIELRVATHSQDPHAYSLDRIDNARGYVRGNVVVMSYLANRLKNDGTSEQHQKIADWMRSLGQ